MRKFCVLAACGLAICFLGNWVSGKDGAARKKQYEIEVALFRGDPDGSREAGTKKILANPRLVTFEGREVNFLVGGESAVKGGEAIEHGLGLRLKVTEQGASQVQVVMCLEVTEPQVCDEQEVVTHGTITRVVKMVRLGEVVRRKVVKDGQPTWVQFSVTEVRVCQ